MNRSKTGLIASAMALSVSNAAYAQAQICTSGANTRTLEIIQPGKVGKACDLRVLYEPGGVVKTPFHANNNSGFCAQKLPTVVASLKANGFTCAAGAATVTAAVPQTQPEPQTPAPTFVTPEATPAPATSAQPVASNPEPSLPTEPAFTKAAESGELDLDALAEDARRKAEENAAAERAEAARLTAEQAAAREAAARAEETRLATERQAALERANEERAQAERAAAEERAIAQAAAEEAARETEAREAAEQLAAAQQAGSAGAAHGTVENRKYNGAAFGNDDPRPRSCCGWPCGADDRFGEYRNPARAAENHR